MFCIGYQADVYEYELRRIIEQEKKKKYFYDERTTWQKLLAKEMENFLLSRGDRTCVEFARAGRLWRDRKIASVKNDLKLEAKWWRDYYAKVLREEDKKVAQLNAQLFSSGEQEVAAISSTSCGPVVGGFVDRIQANAALEVAGSQNNGVVNQNGGANQGDNGVVNQGDSGDANPSTAQRNDSEEGVIDSDPLRRFDSPVDGYVDRFGPLAAASWCNCCELLAMLYVLPPMGFLFFLVLGLTARGEGRSVFVGTQGISIALTSIGNVESLQKKRKFI